jgi:branched-subunit amino acid ABC-type transport system permease component
LILTPDFLAREILNGLQYGMLLLLVTAALALIFGLMDVINFAHGALYALGAYVGVVVLGATQQFWLALILAPLIVGLFGVVLERTVIRRLRGRPPIDTLLLTFGLALVLEEAIRVVWGPNSYPLEAPEALSGVIQIPWIGAYPKYRVFVILAGAVVAGALIACLQMTRFGLLVRGVASDAEMVGSLGVNVPLVMTSVFGIGTGLAALAGVIVGPLIGAYPSMGIDIIIDAFVVLIVGGLGSFWGAVLAALLIGQAVTLGNAFIPEAAMVIIFALMGAVLLWRPRGILGQGRT